MNEQQACKRSRFYVGWTSYMLLCDNSLPLSVSYSGFEICQLLNLLHEGIYECWFDIIFFYIP